MVVKPDNDVTITTQREKKETKYILYVLYLQYKTVGIICHQKPGCCWDAVDALVEHDTARV